MPLPDFDKSSQVFSAGFGTYGTSKLSSSFVLRDRLDDLPMRQVAVTSSLNLPLYKVAQSYLIFLHHEPQNRPQDSARVSEVLVSTPFEFQSPQSLLPDSRERHRNQ